MFLPFDPLLYDRALYEQSQRAPFMVTKFADNDKRRAGQVRGLVIEHHVRAWLRERLGERVMSATNEGDWRQYCNHDLKIKCAGGHMLVDVSGPKSDGSFGNYAQKPSGCHYHLLAKPVAMQTWQLVDFAQGFEVLGAVTHVQYTQRVNMGDVMPMESWLALLEV